MTDFPKSLIPQIIFEDPHLVVLAKPAGLLSQGEVTEDFNLVDWLKVYFGRNYVGLIHRLDRNTSGIMVVAKRTKSAQRLTLSLQKDQIERSYLAWVMGTLNGDLHWRHWLLKDPKTNKVRVLPEKEVKTLQARKLKVQEAALTARALTHSVWQGSPLTLLELKLETGRSHQIRVQAAAENHPLLGDLKYGKKDAPAFPRVALHSHRIRFPHPMTQEILSFTAEIPEDFQKIKKL